jgi:Plasmid pRiA4b ORF-3-like protein
MNSILVWPVGVTSPFHQQPGRECNRLISSFFRRSVSLAKRQRYSDPKHGLGAGITDENRTRLGDVICTPGARLLYEYDFGDGWQHELLLEEVLLGDESFRQICVAGDRNCPPEDCGGPQSFSELLKILQDSTHPEHDDIREWVGEDFAPEYFTVDEINRKLHRRKH